MRIILIHNKYQQAGGEDLVFQSEGDLLISHGHQVEFMVFDNREIKTSVDRLLSGLKVVYNPSSSQRLKQKIESFRPDIIHVHNFVPLASPSIFFAAKAYNIPVVVTLHNYRLICPSATLFYNNAIYEKSVRATFPWHAVMHGVYRDSKLQTAALSIAIRLHNFIGTWSKKVDRFIVLTEFARQKFEHSILRTSPHAIVVKPNFVLDHGAGSHLRENFYLYIGRLTEEKGIGTLLDAARLYNFHLVIVGDGPMRKLVEDFCRDHSHVTYLGYQGKETILTYLKRCKALLFPSTWYEGFPMTILEAFSTGTPVIASKLGSMAEIVTDEINGLHFKAGDAADLVTKLQLMDKKPELGDVLSQNARDIYVKNYTPEINYNLLIDIYAEVLQEGKYQKI